MEDYVLEVKNLTKSFYKHKAEIKAVEQVNFHIVPGECLGLIGESGSGKSTIANLVGGLLTATAGDIIFFGHPLPKKAGGKGHQCRREMQMVFQNPTSSFSPRMSILNSICDGLRYYNRISGKELRHKAYEAMEMVGLNQGYAQRFCGELSGGECQRAAIARAIMIRPKLLICDEITSDLDVSVQAQMIRLLLQLKEELNLSYLFISHDLSLMSSICQRVAVMEKGRIVEIGSVTEITQQAKHPYTRHMLDSVILPDELFQASL